MSEKVRKCLNDLTMFVDEVQTFIDEQQTEQKNNRMRDVYCIASEKLEGAKAEITAMNELVKRTEQTFYDIVCEADNIRVEIAVNEKTSHDNILHSANLIVDMSDLADEFQKDVV